MTKEEENLKRQKRILLHPLVKEMLSPDSVEKIQKFNIHSETVVGMLIAEWRDKGREIKRMRRHICALEKGLQIDLWLSQDTTFLKRGGKYEVPTASFSSSTKTTDILEEGETYDETEEDY